METTRKNNVFFGLRAEKDTFSKNLEGIRTQTPAIQQRPSRRSNQVGVAAPNPPTSPISFIYPQSNYPPEAFTSGYLLTDSFNLRGTVTTMADQGP